MIVEWTDAQTELDALPIEDIKGLMPVKTISIGLLVHKAEDHIIVTSMLFGDDTMSYSHVIPMAMIDRLTVIPAHVLMELKDSPEYRRPDCKDEASMVVDKLLSLKDKKVK